MEPRRTKRKESELRQGIEIRTGARLHFGLMDVRPPFGGAGMMIDRPLTRVRVEAAERFEARGPAQQRVRTVAERLASFLPEGALPSCRITVLQRPDAHSGLGTGTQLALAVAQGLASWLNLPLDERELAGDVADRGHRSIVGSLGFRRGGMLIDRDPPSRFAVPAAWRILLLLPRQTMAKVCGDRERLSFARLQPAAAEQRQRLQNLLDQQIVPALRCQDFAAFSEAIYQYNYHSGLLFAPVQQGPYNGKPIDDLIGALRAHDVRGVGQSSWGPTVFAFCQSAEQAQHLARLPAFQAYRPRCVQPANTGYEEHAIASEPR